MLAAIEAQQVRVRANRTEAEGCATDFEYDLAIQNDFDMESADLAEGAKGAITL